MLLPNNFSSGSDTYTQLEFEITKPISKCLIFNPLTSVLVIQLWLHVISWHNPFEDRFCTSKKGGIGVGGQVLAQGAVHMAAALAGCREALVGTVFAISLLFDTNGHR